MSAQGAFGTGVNRLAGFPGIATGLPQLSDGGMAEVINLRAARKDAKRIEERKRAAQNRAASGRSKSERQLEQARQEKARRDLESHRIEGKDGA